jgi:hypothetical protein
MSSFFAYCEDVENNRFGLWRQTDTSTSSSWARNINELLLVYSNLLFRGGRLNHLLNTARDYI